MISKIPFLIGEIGINHNGSVQLAKKLIKLAKESGLDAVKFQKRDLNICVPIHMRSKIRNTPWGEMTYFDYKKKIEFGKKDYDIIDKYCKKIGIPWFASAWDTNSIKFLKKYRLKYNKISSALMSNKDFIIQTAKLRKKTFISTGGASLNEISEVVKIFKKFNCPFILMHSVSIYPCKDEYLNLEFIRVLKKRFGDRIGYSGHESTVLPSLVAITLGAKAIERHITLDRTLWGTDQSASLETAGIKSLVDGSLRVNNIIGKGIKKTIKLEKSKLRDMIYWQKNKSI